MDKNHGNDDGIAKAMKDLIISDKTITLKKMYLIPELDHDNELFIIDLPFTANFLAQVFAWG